MSNKEEKEQSKPQPNPLGFFKFRNKDERMQGVNAIIKSDKDNETKTRIPNVFAMTYFDSLGAWSSPTEFITTEFEGKPVAFPKTVEGLANYFGHRYRINAISKNGESRAEFVSALSAYLAQAQMMMAQAHDIRMEEGAKKKQ